MDENRTEAPEGARRKATSLLGRARSQHTELAQALGRLEPGSAATTQLAAIIANLRSAEIQLEQVIDSPGASRADLAGVEMLLRGSELAADAAVQAAAASSSAAGAEDLVTTTARTRQTVQEISQDVFGRRVFDPYLRFRTEEEERAYRTREAERQLEIERLQATGRPQDALRAGEILRGQLDDAGRHGAASSPDYAPMRRRLDEQLQRQREANQHGLGDDGRDRAGQNARVNEGYSRIGRHTAQHALNEPDRPWTSDEPRRVQTAAAPAPRTDATGAPAQAAAPGTVSAQDMMGGVDLASLGISAAPATPASPAAEGHGLPDQTRLAADSRPTGRSTT